MGKSFQVLLSFLDTQQMLPNTSFFRKDRETNTQTNRHKQFKETSYILTIYPQTVGQQRRDISLERRTDTILVKIHQTTKG